MDKCVDIIKDRIDGISNDLKAFLYIRKLRLQHEGTEDNIGGGNLVAALSLFSIFNLLSRACYCFEYPGSFDKDGNVNETDAFVYFVKFLKKNGVDLGLPSSDIELQKVWKEFRGYLAHVMVVGQKMRVITFIYDKPLAKTSVGKLLDSARNFKPFEMNVEEADWQLNTDVLMAYVPEIMEKVSEYLLQHRNSDLTLLKTVIRTTV